MNQHRTAVNINSNALAKVFNIEFSDRKNKLTTIPMAALLIMIDTTLTWRMDDRLAAVKAPVSSPWYVRMRQLQTIESKYINTFCTMMWISLPLPFNRYSLYTPAKHEQNTCNKQFKVYKTRDIWSFALMTWLLICILVIVYYCISLVTNFMC